MPHQMPVSVIVDVSKAPTPKVTKPKQTTDLTQKQFEAAQAKAAEAAEKAFVRETGKIL